MLCVFYHNKKKKGGVKSIQVAPGTAVSSQPAQSCLSFSQFRNESFYKYKSQATALLTAGVSEFPISLCKYQLISNSFSKAPQNPAKAVLCFAKGWSGSPYTGLTRAQSMSSKLILRRGLSSELSKQDASTFACDLHLLCIGPHKLCPHSQTSLTSYFKTVTIFD